MTQTEQAPELQKGLRQRHMTMIALGGVIGAGLFVGSGAVIHRPARRRSLSYLLAGTLVVLVMRMLGEMAVAQPDASARSPSTRAGARRRWAGFTVGWLYWYFWVIVAGRRGGGGRGDRPALAARRADVGAGARPHGRS